MFRLLVTDARRAVLEHRRARIRVRVHVRVAVHRVRDPFVHRCLPPIGNRRASRSGNTNARARRTG